MTAEGQKLLERGIERVVISLGGRGALYLRKGSTIYAEGLKVPVGSTVGAGDSVVAALAYAESQDMSEEDAVRLDCNRSRECHVQRHTGRRALGYRAAASESTFFKL